MKSVYTMHHAWYTGTSTGTYRTMCITFLLIMCGRYRYDKNHRHGIAQKDKKM
jgi:hypothetical protein